MGEEIVFVRRASGLVRELEWYDVMLWALATPAASGMTYYAVQMLGDSSAYGGSPILAFFLAGLIFLPMVLAFLLIASSFPRSSSLYVFVSRTIHPILGYLPFWYFIIGGGAAMASGLLMYIGIKSFSGPLVVAGILSGNSALISLGEALVNPVNQLIVAVVLIIVVWTINMFGMRVIKWFIRIITIIPLIVTLSILIGLLILGQNGGIARWNNVFGSGSAESIMDIALGRASGVDISPLTSVGLLAGTYAMLTWTLWAWSGLEIVTFVGSEVKHPTRSYIRGYTLGFIAVMAIYLLNAFTLPYVFNYDFLASYSYLQSNYPDILSRYMGGVAVPDPSVPFFASISFGNAILAIVIGLAYLLWYFNTTIPIWVAAVRGFFSMAFDRALPEKMAEVSPRFAAPTWANHITAIVAFLGAIMTFLEDEGYAMAGAVVRFMDFSLFLFVWPVGLALMLVPWWRPEIFKQMTFPSKALTATIGAIVFALGWWLMLYTSYADPWVQIVNIIVGLIGILIFVYMSARNRARGIDPSRIYGQIPPA